jgi:predicted RecB family nuclease
MQCIDGRFVYSTSDLTNYVECKRLTELEALVARAKLTRPPDDDERAALIRRKGEEHEQRFLSSLQDRYGRRIVSIARPEASLAAFADAEKQTRAAMATGAPIIYQATFFDGRFVGHADFLRRIESPSEDWPWSYEVLDTKLAVLPKPYFLVQLCSYSEHVERLQGSVPSYGYIVLGDGEEVRYRLHDYAAYYRHLKAAFLAFAGDATRRAADAPLEYPHRCKHCEICIWNDACTRQRRDDDHLSLVAWMRRDQIAKFEDAGIESVAALARADDAARPIGMNPETFVKLRRQAQLQLRGRSNGPLYELLRHAPPLGFGLLPEPATGDVFFDIEGDPLYAPERGLEYLFGCWMPDDDPPYRAFWAFDRSEEKSRFEEFVDFIVARRRQYPALHVYHYANYEKSTLRRLAQVHCTREDEIDDLLRSEALVDLYAVVRQALAISEESYGLKKVERFYELRRETEVRKGDDSIVMFERWLLCKDRAILADIQAYNRDDCYSTFLLREWLLERRREAISSLSLDLPLRLLKSKDEPCHPDFLPGCQGCDKRRAEELEERRRSDLERRLLTEVSEPPATQSAYAAMPEELRTRYLLAHLLAYHRREEKPAWWAYYDRCENADELFEFDREALGGLRLRDDVPPYKHSATDRTRLVYTYAFPDQQHKMTPGEAHDPRTRSSAGEIVEVDDEQSTLKLRRSGTVEDARAVQELIPPGPPSTLPQRKALARIAQSFVDGRLADDHPATYDLMAGRSPRVRNGSLPDDVMLQPQCVTAEAVSKVVRALDSSYLFVQGPPGSGKSTKGSYIICDLLQRGRRVGVLSTGHKAIHHLLHKVEECSAERGIRFRGLYKHTKGHDGSQFRSRQSQAFIESVDRYDAFNGDGYDLAGGTAWLFAREELVGAFDYLFIDEAGQVSLADAVAVSTCAKNVVLLGDPSQLAQVSQGRHPLHADDSVLAHLLGDAPTIPPSRGIFLNVSYRMQPEICAFISDAVYENRLEPDPDTSLHRVLLDDQSRAGLYYVPIEHAGNSSNSPDEADWIVREIALLLGGTVVDSQPRDQRGLPRPLEERDIIVVTPYNAQRRLIARKLDAAGIAVQVGTVDKFQGQEAAVVFYSMATSSGDDVPRDLEFLFERNRLNVAVSRARAMSVLVCSPRLLDVDCRTPEQMALVNLLCAFAEEARRGNPLEGLQHLSRNV